MSKDFKMVAVMQAAPGKEKALAAALAKMAEMSRTEPGCLQFEAHRNAEKPDTLVVLEHWVDDAALQAHFKGAAVAAFVAAGASEMIAGNQLHRLDPL